MTEYIMYEISLCYPPMGKDKKKLEEWVELNDATWWHDDTFLVKSQQDVTSFKLFWPDENIFSIVEHIHGGYIP